MGKMLLVWYMQRYGISAAEGRISGNTHRPYPSPWLPVPSMAGKVGDPRRLLSTTVRSSSAAGGKGKSEARARRGGRWIPRPPERREGGPSDSAEKAGGVEQWSTGEWSRPGRPCSNPKDDSPTVLLLLFRPVPVMVTGAGSSRPALLSFLGECLLWKHIFLHY